jgi:hypothetical protein
MAITAVYEVPSSDGKTYNEVHFITGADEVKETADKKFVSFATDLKNNTTKSSNAVVNAATLGDILSNCKIVISPTQPAAISGYNILWIDTTTLV